MSELRFEAVRHAELAYVNAAFNAGTHVVVGSEGDGTSTLIAITTGMFEPAAGRVRLDGVAPWSHAATRRRIASSCASEVLLPARDVAAAIALALRARGEVRSGKGVLDDAGLAHFAAKRVSALTPRETRAIALSLALSHREPALLALHDPLSLVGIVQEDFVTRTLRERSDAGAIVLCTARRMEDAARLGGEASALERGTWIAPAYAQPPLGAVTLRVHTPEPRRLAARLSEAPDISGVEWAGGHELLVHGSELERVAHSVVANARAEVIRITALKADAPTLEALAAARAALARAYYERSAATGSATRPS
ncbi:MAG TPA: ATP-binding cassette domain-containing protein [Polyangiaceae bacterium]|nr:ATP-binding cassette domain-containing protein [Polyangiaceae bacterium]